MKKVFLAGVGAVATTAETAKEIVDDLVTKGELTVEQGKVLNEELKRNTKQKIKDHVTVKCHTEYKDAFFSRGTYERRRACRSEGRRSGRQRKEQKKRHRKKRRRKPEGRAGRRSCR